MQLFTTLLTTILTLGTLVSAHNVNLLPHSRECFHENLHIGDRMTVTFQVGDRETGGNSGSLEIDFWVCPSYSLSLFIFVSS
jgi:p24 family protein beta-1